MKNALKNIIFYDSDCLLCLWSVRFVLRYDRSQSILFSSFHSEVARSLLADYEIDSHAPQSIIYLQNGRVYKKSDAIVQIANNFGFLMSRIKWIKWAPKKWRDAIYDFIAENRYRVFRKTKTCFLPHESILHRFLD